MSRLLDGRVALISGGGRGIGLAIAEALAGAGANVMIADSGTGIDGRGLDPEVARAAAARIGGDAEAFTDDLAEPAAAVGAVQATLARFRRLDIVVNNAAILRDALIFKSDPADWQAVIATNLSAAHHLLAAATPVLRAQAKDETGYDRGRVINLTSTAGLYGNFGQAAYASAKAGLVGLTRAVAHDLRRSKVTVNAIAPFAATRVTDSIKPANQAQAIYKQRALTIAPEHVARLVVYLCSPLAQDITGQLFGVRGREVFIFSQPRPLARVLSKDWRDDPAAFDRQLRAGLAPHFADLMTDLEAFSSDPVV